MRNTNFAPYRTVFFGAVDVKCKKINGYLKGVGHQPGNVISFHHQTDHAWNAVYLEDKWQLVESTWGSGFLVGNHGRRVIERFTDFYFLT